MEREGGEYNERGSLVWYSTNTQRHKQARRNERPLSAFVGGEKDTENEGERALTDGGKRQRERDREREEIAGWIT